MGVATKRKNDTIATDITITLALSDNSTSLINLYGIKPLEIAAKNKVETYIKY